MTDKASLFPPDPQPVTLILVPWRTHEHFKQTMYIARWDVSIFPSASTGGPCLFTTAFDGRGSALAKLRYLMMRELGRHFEWEITEVREDF